MENNGVVVCVSGGGGMELYVYGCLGIGYCVVSTNVAIEGNYSIRIFFIASIDISSH